MIRVGPALSSCFAPLPAVRSGTGVEAPPSRVGLPDWPADAAVAAPQASGSSCEPEGRNSMSPSVGFILVVMLAALDASGFPLKKDV
jgi:hypothetical protein